jgi:hypothetical protein
MSDSNLLHQCVSVRTLGLDARGWRVFPCQSKGKKPHLTDWPHRATRDPTEVKSLWSRFPAPNIAVATGQGSGIFVLDVDGHDLERRSGLRKCCRRDAHGVIETRSTEPDEFETLASRDGGRRGDEYLPMFLVSHHAERAFLEFAEA